MGSTWTQPQVLGLAPDGASAKAGQALATPSKWPLLGRTDASAWGECQGSGSKPYQTRIDLAEPAFKCSCPSRKFPCKHALGLFLLLVDGKLPPADPPPWVTDWLANRAERQEQQQERAAARSRREADPAAREKREQRRARAVAGGIDLAQRWILDLVTEGLAAAQARPVSFWEETAAQLVDAQCPGLAGAVRRIASSCTSGDQWQQRMLDELARLWLLTQAARALPALPADLAAEARAMIGYTVTREEVAEQGERLADDWLVVGRFREDDGRLRTQRTWLWGAASDRPALVLDFAAAGAPLDQSLSPGSSFEGELAFYPGVASTRALLRTRNAATPVADWGPRGDADLAAALRRHRANAARNPWLTRQPLLIRAAHVIRLSDHQWGVGTPDRALPLAAASDVWRLLGASAGAPFAVFGEWDGHRLLALSAYSAERFCGLAREAAA